MCSCNNIEVNPTATIATNGTVTVAILFQLLNAKFVAHIKDSEGNIVATLTEATDPELTLPDGTYELCVDSFVVKADCCYGDNCQCAKPSGCLCTSFEVIAPPKIHATIHFTNDCNPIVYAQPGTVPTQFQVTPLSNIPNDSKLYTSEAELLSAFQLYTGVSWYLDGCTAKSNDIAAAPYDGIIIETYYV